MQDYSKILILRNGAVGDCVLSIPTLAAIRRAFPAAQITLLGDPFSVSVYEHSPYLDRLISLDPKKLSLLAYLARLLALRRERFPLVIDLHGAGRSFMQGRIIGGRRRIGFAIRPRHERAYTDHLPYRTDVHTVYRQAEILKLLGVELDPAEAAPRISLVEKEREEARELLAQAGLRPGEPYAVMHATVGLYNPLKQWEPERFARLADWLQRERGLRVALVGSGDQEEPVLTRIFQAVQEPLLNLVGQTPLRVLAAVLEGASVYVGCDTGPMHLAAAVGTPLVALFGPTDPATWGPFSSAPAEVVRVDLECSPCGRRECPFNLECMNLLDVERVISAVQQIEQKVPGA